MFVCLELKNKSKTAYYQREVRLPNGGSIVIDQTEALVSIDINSSKPPKARMSQKRRLIPIWKQQMKSPVNYACVIWVV